jgi:hypothetical protein
MTVPVVPLPSSSTMFVRVIGIGYSLVLTTRSESRTRTADSTP